MEHQLSLFPCLFASRVTVWWQAILGDFNDVMYQNGLVLQPRATIAPTIATNLFHVESRFLLTRDLFRYKYNTSSDDLFLLTRLQPADFIHDPLLLKNLLEIFAELGEMMPGLEMHGNKTFNPDFSH